MIFTPTVCLLLESRDINKPRLHNHSQRSTQAQFGKKINMADAYEGVSRGSLKLKGVVDGGVKKKKKKNKEKKKLEEAAAESMAKGSNQEKQNSASEDTRTPAQKAYDKIQEKRAAERILKKAEQTHKQRVEKFNEYLDGLTEHYDIPKVSWTK